MRWLVRVDHRVAELRRRIITAGVTHRTVEFLRFLRAKAQTCRDSDGMKYWDAIVRIAQAQRTDLPDPLRPHRVN